jgi:hypothetical protein
MTYPVFASGDVLNASDMNGVGLWLVKSQTVGTGVTSSTVTGAFTSDYDNYQIVISGVACSAGGLSMLIQVGGGTANYYGSCYYDRYNAGNTGTIRTNNGSALYFGVTDTNSVSMAFTVTQPVTSKITGFQGTYYGGDYSGWCGGTYAVASPVTSFTLVCPGGATMTGGTIKVYGMRN